MEFQMAPENEQTKNESLGLNVNFGSAEGKKPVSMRIVVDDFRDHGYGEDSYKDYPEFLCSVSDYAHFEQIVEKSKNELDNLKPLAKIFFEAKRL